MVLVERTISECSDDIDIRPLEFDDLKRGLDECSSEDDEQLRIPDNSNRFFSVVYGIGKKRKKAEENRSRFMAKMAWKNAVIKAKALGDPWKKFSLDEYKKERALRHRYNSLKQCWVEDEVDVKMEEVPFNHGAMRECFRMKKLSNFCKGEDWTKAHNYVAKRYIEEGTPRRTYFDDVRLQMDAKLWGEEFNRHNPPKKIDIFQMCVLEFIEREDRPLYHLEHFIEGKYVKYNSNSGYVRSEAMRMTPQAFSHFTFERSGHELIVVDIQGVGDLYTDPQIHTTNGLDYGDGNLGTRGMALFFHSHICNSICKSLQLSEFDLAPSEIQTPTQQLPAQVTNMTLVRGAEEKVVPPREEERENIQDYIRLRSLSSGYMSTEEQDLIDSIYARNSFRDSESEDSAIGSAKKSRIDEEEEEQERKVVRRARFDSSSDSFRADESYKSNLLEFNEKIRKKSRPSHVMGELEHLQLIEKLEIDSRMERSTLGQIHLDMAKYHELNRFVEETEDYDKAAALFHVEHAALCGNLECIVAMVRLHYSLPHDILPDVELEDNKINIDKGFKFLEMAGSCGDRASMVQLAKAYDNGQGLPELKAKDWSKAVHWYDAVVNKDTADTDGNFDGISDDPHYLLVARQAHMYWEGGHSLDKDPNKAGELFSWAADLATEAMKGKLASKYYMLSEEAWAECE